jgi:hypothetical protein
MSGSLRSPCHGASELHLRGDAEARYLARAVAAVTAARLSRQFPDARRLAQHLGCLGPQVHCGLYPGLEIDVRSGLPCYRAWTRLLADREVAARALAELPARAELEERARSAGAPIHGKRLLKHDYYTTLAAKPPVSLSSLQVLLRRVIPEENRAEFTILFDKLELTGLVVRYSIELEQRASVWNRRMVTLTEETAGRTEELQALVFQMAGTDAELLFAHLAAVPGLRVESVTKGTVGPFFFAGMRVPPALGPLVRDEHGFVGTFALDRAACDQPADVSNDPLGELLAERLSAEAHATYVAARARWGYHVFKDRKLVVPARHLEATRIFCRESGTRNIVYPLPGAAS